MDILESSPQGEKGFYGHNLDIFLPPSEQCKRIGVQTWQDFPEPNVSRGFAVRDGELMRNKMKASLTIPIAGK